MVDVDDHMGAAYSLMVVMVIFPRLCLSNDFIGFEDWDDPGCLPDIGHGEEDKERLMRELR